MLPFDTTLNLCTQSSRLRAKVSVVCGCDTTLVGFCSQPIVEEFQRPALHESA